MDLLSLQLVDAVCQLVTVMYWIFAVLLLFLILGAIHLSAHKKSAIGNKPQVADPNDK